MGKKRAKEMAEALEASIEHWQRYADGDFSDDKPTDSNCALCQLQPENDENSCGDCVVQENTGVPYCEETPFHRAAVAWGRWSRPENPGTFKKAAKVEVEFLKSLRSDDN